MTTILVVDDEVRLVKLVRAYLERAGYDVVVAYDGPEALDVFRRSVPDLVVLDLNLPGLDGLDVFRSLRQESDAPVVMLTARVDEGDRVSGLELGADDYVTKPFSPRELVARVGAVLRRSERTAAPAIGLLRRGNLVMDPARRIVRLNEREIDLTPTEFDLLRALAQHPGQVFSRAQLMSQLQGDWYEADERTVDAHVKNLRQKIEADPRRPSYVLTVFGVGYKFADEFA
ncbi:MAG: response regulator transcription factor [Chloroflexi bacterium]|nr:response regulator transcription factor [Chloroflexota bacterium]MBU1877863.1 response regulator transcription factor [Chloroflexota bacterium]